MKKLENMLTADLRALARDRNVKDWWNLKKAELIKEIEAAELVQMDVLDAPEETKTEEHVNTLLNEENVPEDVQEPTRKNHKRLIEYNGKTQTLTAWAKELGIRHQTLYNRIVMKGWDIDRAFEKPTKKETVVNAETVEIE